jgi:hypothetical protein
MSSIFQNFFESEIDIFYIVICLKDQEDILAAPQKGSIKYLPCIIRDEDFLIFFLPHVYDVCLGTRFIGRRRRGFMTV